MRDKNPAFQLKKPTNNGLFMPTAPSDISMDGIRKIGEKIYISGDKLRHYRNHEFELYQGGRHRDMVESIKEDGIIKSLIVQPYIDEDGVEYNGIFEILSGHNRFECGKEAGLTEFPCTIEYGLSKNEAHIIVTVTNLFQRGFSDLSHSKRAQVITTYYNSIKQQGRRTDLIKKIEIILNNEDTTFDEERDEDEKNPRDKTHNQTCDPLGHKSIETIGEKYGLSKNSVARYIRLNNLIDELKTLLDSEELAIRAGVSLSYIESERQHTIFTQIERYQIFPSMKQAEQLRKLNTHIPADEVDSDNKFLLGCADILLGRGLYHKETKPKKTINFKLERVTVESYFKEDETEQAIQKTILEALEFYHQHKNNVNGGIYPFMNKNG